jgi:UDP-N-acetyl-D-glucosamine dehydrogenase
MDILIDNSLYLCKDYLLAFSPEREDPGNTKYNITNIPKLVGGVDSSSSIVAFELYKKIIHNVINVWDSKIAESAKLLENIFRLVNISLINELREIFNKMDIDIWKVIDAASTKPFGFMPFYPGPGIGGHCIPCDPVYFNYAAQMNGMTSEFINHSINVNNNTPIYISSFILKEMNKIKKPISDQKVLLIGVAYKKNINDNRDSSFFKIYDNLKEYNVTNIDYHDPYFEEISIHGKTIKGIDINNIDEYDIIVILTNHDNINFKQICQNNKTSIIIDTRNSISYDYNNIKRI